MAQSDARFGYRANLGRQDHNLSQPFGFSACPGMLLPIWFDLATPGDSYYMSHDMPLLRSIQLLAPSMVDVKVHFETFFVPFQMIYQPSENTLFSILPIQSSLYSPGFTINDDFPLFNYEYFVESAVSTKDELTADCFRLADLFGLAPCNFTGVIGQSDMFMDGYLKAVLPKFFPYQILTYHTIFNYYYRLDDKTVFANKYCNWDQYYSAHDIVGQGKDFMQIHQRPWDFDYYTSIYRSPIVSDENMDSILPAGKYSSLSDQVVQGLKLDRSSAVTNSAISSFSSRFANTYYLPDSQGSNSTAVIRQLFANEKLAMITGRTRKNYDSQVLAHYGISVPHDVKHDLTMIHHDVYDLNVQEVTNLASTAESPLGELAGKSYSAGNGKQFKFTAPCHGVMMTIFSIEPKKRYVSSGFDRINAITNAYDLPTPEFDRLGNVPMFRNEVGIALGNNQGSLSDIVGWKERYYQFKRKSPKVTFGYFTGNGENNYGSYFVTSMPFGKSVISSNAGMQTIPDSLKPRPDLEDRFYIERGCLDNLVYQPYFAGWKQVLNGENWNNTPWLLYVRDPFIVNTHIKCKKVSWMSKDGEPIYD